MGIAPVSTAAPAADTAALRRPMSLDGDLAKCETQLADWTHCVSAKTPEGKAKIAEISAKIAEIKVKMERAKQAKSASIDEVKQAPRTVGDPSKAPRTGLNTLGGHIDTYA